MKVAEHLFNPSAFGESEGDVGEPEPAGGATPPCQSHLSHDAAVPR